MAKLNKLEDKADGDTLHNEDVVMGNVTVSEEELLKTPSKKKGKQIEEKTPSTGSTKKLTNTLVTPRRSTRKTQKPLLDYQEIICNSATKSLQSIPEISNEFTASATADESSEQKWSIAEVDGDRHKPSRRSRRNSKLRTKSQTDNVEKEDDVKLTEVDLSPIKEEKEKQQVNEINEMHAVVDQLHERPVVEDITASNVESKFHTHNGTHQKLLEEKREADDIIDLTTPLKPVKNEESMISFGSHLKPGDAEMEDLGLVTLHDETDNSIGINSNQEAKDDTMIKLKLSESGQVNDNVFEISEDEDGDKENQKPTTMDLASLPPIKTMDQNETNDDIPVNDVDSSIPLELSASEVPHDEVAYGSIQSTVKSTISLQEINESEVTCSYFQATHAVTTMENKKIVLHGIRKRSLSVCIGESCHKMQSQILKEPDSKLKTKKSVKFYSPANEMTIIDDLDSQIAQSAASFSKMAKESIQAGGDISRRPKRSVSMDDLWNRSRIPRPKSRVNHTPTKKKTPLKESPASKEKTVRSKLPNFAAIHERQFNKMENLFEYVYRKQERSRNLLNSNVKVSGGSGQKVSKQEMAVSSTKFNELKKQSQQLTTERPRSQKVLQMTSSTPKKLIAAVKPLTTTKSPMKLHSSASITTASQKPYQPPHKPFKLGNNAAVDNKMKKDTSKDKAMEDKAAERLQRHMDLFKGRTHSTTESKVKDHREKESYIRGVRSNRRFELLMNHRRNMEK